MKSAKGKSGGAPTTSAVTKRGASRNAAALKNSAPISVSDDESDEGGVLRDSRNGAYIVWNCGCDARILNVGQVSKAGVVTTRTKIRTTPLTPLQVADWSSLTRTTQPTFATMAASRRRRRRGRERRRRSLRKRRPKPRFATRTAPRRRRLRRRKRGRRRLRKRAGAARRSSQQKMTSRTPTSRRARHRRKLQPRSPGTRAPAARTRGSWRAPLEMNADAVLYSEGSSGKGAGAGASGTATTSGNGRKYV